MAVVVPGSSEGGGLEQTPGLLSPCLLLFGSVALFHLNNNNNNNNNDDDNSL